MVRLLFALPVAMLALAAGTPPVVRVTGGLVRGALVPSGGAVFKGMPFAQPPVGDLRWREPQPVVAWKGERDATRHGAACVQSPLGTGAFLRPLARLYGAPYQPPAVVSAEDCLYLSVWTPEWPARQPAAVMVWIHGGSNVSGSGAQDGYDGAALARKGVVVVTINYRLGALGFFSHPELTRESAHKASGNYGLLDQIAALAWVRRNIAGFGGDPGRVTVFGESAGAINAGLLLCSPLAAGLFHRAILQSGPVLGLAANPASLAAGERFGDKVAQSLGFTGGGVIGKLRDTPPGRVLEAVAKVRATHPDPGIVLDGWCLPQSPAEVFAQAKQLPADLIVGNNGREISAFRAKGGGEGAGPSLGGNALMQTLRIFYGRSATLVVGLVAVDNLLRRTEASDEWLNDVACACPAMSMAVLHAQAGHRAYIYQFLRSIPGPGEKALGSFHGLELPYLFASFRRPEWSWLPFEAVDSTLGERMQSYWTNFARTGNPNAPHLPGWTPFDARSRSALEFGRRGAVSLNTKARPAFCDLDLPGLKQRLQYAIAQWSAAARPAK